MDTLPLCYDREASQPYVAAFAKAVAGVEFLYQQRPDAARFESDVATLVYQWPSAQLGLVPDLATVQSQVGVESLLQDPQQIFSWIHEARQLIPATDHEGRFDHAERSLRHLHVLARIQLARIPGFENYKVPYEDAYEAVLGHRELLRIPDDAFQGVREEIIKELEAVGVGVRDDDLGDAFERWRGKLPTIPLSDYEQYAQNQVNGLLAVFRRAYNDWLRSQEGAIVLPGDVDNLRVQTKLQSSIAVLHRYEDDGLSTILLSSVALSRNVAAVRARLAYEGVGHSFLTWYRDVATRQGHFPHEAAFGVLGSQSTPLEEGLALELATRLWQHAASNEEERRFFRLAFLQKWLVSVGRYNCQIGLHNGEWNVERLMSEGRRTFSFSKTLAKHISSCQQEEQLLFALMHGPGWMLVQRALQHPGAIEELLRRPHDMTSFEQWVHEQEHAATIET